MLLRIGIETKPGSALGITLNFNVQLHVKTYIFPYLTCIVPVVWNNLASRKKMPFLV
jgi:hypothetical protein